MSELAVVFRSLTLCYVLILILSLQWQAASAACHFFPDVINNGSYGVADENGEVTAACNIDTPFIPASIIKIPTVLAAFNILGQDFRFKTEFFVDDHHNLYIKGYGDPLLISEEVALIIGELKSRGVNRINGIFIDHSSFNLAHQSPGRENSTNPYDAPVGSVSVNFNTVAIVIDSRHRVRSGEPQTPTIPLMKELGKGKKPGSYRINVCRGSCTPEERMARYAAELFRVFQRKAGIAGNGDQGLKKVPVDARLEYTHYNSRSLEEMCGSMLQYSSNFIANLVYLGCGAAEYGYPATWDKAKQAVDLELARLLDAETAKALYVEEGAGLSRNNRVTTRAMLDVLGVFQPYSYLLRKQRGVTAKTGTMKGVYNYAGYLGDGRPFVILLNQQANTRSTVLDRLKQGTHRKGSRK